MSSLEAARLRDDPDRRRFLGARLISLTGTSVTFVALASLPIASWLGGTIAHRLVAAFVVPALFVFFDAADFGAVPSLVGSARIATASSALTALTRNWVVASIALVGWGPPTWAWSPSCPSHA